MLISALLFGLVVNVTVPGLALLLPGGALQGWKYDAPEIFLASAVLLSGSILLALGRLGRTP